MTVISIGEKPCTLNVSRESRMTLQTNVLLARDGLQV